MPHLTLQLSGNLASHADALLAATTAACEESGLFAEAVVMARAVVHTHWRVAQQGTGAFADLVLRVRAGRPAPVRAALSASLADALARVLRDAEPGIKTCITCEIHEIDVDTRTLTFTGGTA